jgi:hypothetical protein
VEHGHELGVGLEVQDVVPKRFLGDGVLVVRLQVHQDVPLVVGVQVFHLPPVEVGRLDVVGGADALVLDRPLGHVAELELHLGAEVPGRVVVGVGDHHQLAVDDDGLALSNVTGSHEFVLLALSVIPDIGTG